MAKSITMTKIRHRLLNQDLFLTLYTRINCTPKILCTLTNMHTRGERERERWNHIAKSKKKGNKLQSHTLSYYSLHSILLINEEIWEYYECPKYALCTNKINHMLAREMIFGGRFTIPQPAVLIKKILFFIKKWLLMSHQKSHFYKKYFF